MDGRRFDAFARTLATAGSRRRLLTALAGGALGSLMPWLGGEAATACVLPGAKCKRTRTCCGDARCRNGRCRCKSDDACPASKPCCINGKCKPKCFDTCCADCCDDTCCAECFVELNHNGNPTDIKGCCGAGGLWAEVCHKEGTSQAQDTCCWSIEECIDGTCCCHGCFGSVICGASDEKCCPEDSCCNDTCCEKGKVCATEIPGEPPTCVSANRPCTTGENCFADEQCIGGVCCSGNRICNDIDDVVGPVCCDAGEWCDHIPGEGQCCPVGNGCVSTLRRTRVRV